jgi:hypothetical protein
MYKNNNKDENKNIIKYSMVCVSFFWGNYVFLVVLII